MKQQRIFLGVFFIIVLCAQAGAGEAEPAGKGERILAALVKTHPRLILTDRRLAEIKWLSTRDPLVTKSLEVVLSRADDYCKKPTLERKKVGVRMIGASARCLERMYTLGLAWRVTGKKKYAEKAREDLLAVCAFADWNPSHFLDTAIMSHAVGIGYDWFFGYFDAATREKIRLGLIRNGMTPGMEAYRKSRKAGWGWNHVRYNHNLVNNGGLVVGSLAIAETDPQYARTIIAEALESMPRALKTYEPDGAWGEGVGYWHFATRYVVYALAAMETALGTDFGLSDRPGLARTGLFPLYMTGTSGQFVNFSDIGERSRRRNIPSLFWLARRYREPVLAQAERATMRRLPGEPLDLIWYVPPGVEKPVRLSLDKLFRGPTEVAVFRSAWDDPDALFVSLKGGYNSQSHAHLDLGTFELDALGTRWARDLGKDSYSLPGYFGGAHGMPYRRRYKIYRIGSFSHNVITLNNRNQDVQAKSKFVTFRSGRDGPRAVLDLSEAYRPVASKALRGVAMLYDRRAVLVQDDLVLAKDCEVVWGMTTDARIRKERSVAFTKLISEKDKEMSVRILSPEGAVFTVESAEQKPPQNPNKGVKRLVIRLKAKAGPLRIAVLLSPHWPDGAVAGRCLLKDLSKW